MTIFFNISAKHNSNLPWLQNLSKDLSIYDVYDMMEGFHLQYWLLSYDPLQISGILPTFLKFNIIFEKFLEILVDSNVTFLCTHVRWQIKNHSEVIWVFIFRYFIKVSMSPKCC